MSDGDGKISVKFLIEKENQLSNRKKKKLVTDEFVQAIARIAVAQVCESLGFQSFQQSALDCLADVGVRYISEIGKIACSYANLSNRSQCNVFDVIQSLEDLGSIQGFVGSSDVSHSLSESGVVRDIVRYVGGAEEIPFAYLIPVFPVIKERKENPSFAEAEEITPHDHIPGWLPKFPDPETYADLSSSNEKDFETGFGKIPKAEAQHKRVERPLRSLQQKLICNGSKAGVAADRANTDKEKYSAEINPFLASPLSFSEKEVSLPILPAKLLNEEVHNHQGGDVLENHLKLEQSSQANEAMEGGTYETDDRGTILLNGRSSIHFKFRSPKNFPGRVPRLQNEGIGDISIWFGNDNDGRDKSYNRVMLVSHGVDAAGTRTLYGQLQFYASSV